MYNVSIYSEPTGENIYKNENVCKCLVVCECM